MYGPKYLFWELQKPRSKHSSTWVVFLGLGWEWEEEWNMRARFWLFRGLPSFCFPWFAILMGSQNTWDATEHNILCDPARWGGFSSVAQSCLTLRPHGLQHAGPPCPSPTPRAYSNSCPLSRWCHPTVSSSVVPFSSHLQSFPALGSFPMSQFFTLGGQSIGVSASASVFPMNTQDWSPLGWTGLISLQSKGLSRVFSNTTVQKHQFFGTQLSL